MDKQKKVCGKCKLPKELSEFNKKKNNKDRLQTWCRLCQKKDSRKYKKTKKGLISLIYSNQKGNSKRKGRPSPNYNNKELQDWILSHLHWEMLYDNWVSSNYDKNLTPSCDRVKNHLPYTLDNLQLVTWGENNENGYRDMRNGKVTHGNKPQKPVVGTCLKTGKIVEFHSIHEAERQLGIAQSYISIICIGKPIHKSNGQHYTPKTTGGYSWKFKQPTKNQDEC